MPDQASPGGAALLALSRDLLALAQEQSAALDRGSFQQLDWLTSRMDGTMAAIRLLAGKVRLADEEQAALRRMADELKAVASRSRGAVTSQLLQ